MATMAFRPVALSKKCTTCSCPPDSIPLSADATSRAFAVLSSVVFDIVIGFWGIGYRCGLPARVFLFLSVAFGLLTQTGHKSIPFSKARKI
jgi:hypothetical protein